MTESLTSHIQTYIAESNERQKDEHPRETEISLVEVIGRLKDRMGLEMNRDKRDDSLFSMLNVHLKRGVNKYKYRLEETDDF